MTQPNCVLCGNNDFSHFIDCTDRFDVKAQYHYNRCNTCNLVMLDIRDNNKGFQAYNLDQKTSKAQQAVFGLLLHRLRKHKKTGDLLDFGAGAGNLAKYLSQKGYNVGCFEIDAASKKHIANIHNLPIVDHLRPNTYDIIIAEQVIEHLPDPLQTLRELKASLKENGVLLISIPDINSFQAHVFKERWFHLDAPRHLNHFYKRSFYTLIDKAGLAIIKAHYFNFHIDPAGWYFGLRGPVSNNFNLNNIWSQIILGVFLPLTFITALLKRTGYVLYVLKSKSLTSHRDAEDCGL